MIENKDNEKIEYKDGTFGAAQNFKESSTNPKTTILVAYTLVEDAEIARFIPKQFAHKR